MSAQGGAQVQANTGAILSAMEHGAGQSQNHDLPTTMLGKISGSGLDQFGGQLSGATIMEAFNSALRAAGVVSILGDISSSGLFARIARSVKEFCGGAQQRLAGITEAVIEAPRALTEAFNSALNAQTVGLGA